MSEDIFADIRELAREVLETTRKQDELMRAAVVTVHRFEEVAKPPAKKMKNGMQLEKDQGPYRYMLLDCTISPRMKKGDTWEPLFVALDQDDPAYEKPEVEDGDRLDPAEGKIYASRVWYAILDKEERERKVPKILKTGARLRMLVACPARMKGAVRLRYLHTTLSELNLPK